MTDVGPNKRFVFVGGHHRSGTTLVYRLMATNPRFSTFQDTGVIEDEGQFLQSVFPPDGEFGGPGAFALHPDAYMTEKSQYIARARESLFANWAPYWDVTADFLAEKSPANIIRSRFLQAVFPNSSFVFVVRHPVAACLAVSKWNRAYIRNLFRNWVRCHQILLEDLSSLRSYTVIRYEDLVSCPERLEEELFRLLGSKVLLDTSIVKDNLNEKYFSKWRIADVNLNVERWKRELKRMKNNIEMKYLERRYEPFIRNFGYSFRDVYL